MHASNWVSFWPGLLLQPTLIALARDGLTVQRRRVLHWRRSRPSRNRGAKMQVRNVKEARIPEIAEPSPAQGAETAPSPVGSQPTFAAERILRSRRLAQLWPPGRAEHAASAWGRDESRSLCGKMPAATQADTPCAAIPAADPIHREKVIRLPPGLCRAAKFLRANRGASPRGQNGSPPFKQPANAVSAASTGRAS